MHQRGDELKTEHGRYILYRRMGEGGQSEVWYARTPERSDRAVKIAGRDANTRIEAEIRALAEIASIPELADHVVRIRDNGIVHVQGSPRRFIVLDYFEHSLEELLQTADLQERTRLAESACASLVAVQRALPRLVHRDIKPANFLVKRPFVVISDYGAVKDLDSHTTSQGLQTLAYAPPEQHADPSRGVNPGWDTYAMAATVFHVLVGDPPHIEGDGSLSNTDIERIRQKFKEPIKERGREGQRLVSALDSMVGALQGILRAKPHERVGLDVLERACGELLVEMERPVTLEVIALPPVRNLNDTARISAGRVEAPVKREALWSAPPKPALDETVMGTVPPRLASPPAQVVSSPPRVSAPRAQAPPVLPPQPQVVEPPRFSAARSESSVGLGVKVFLGLGMAFGGLVVLGVVGWVKLRKVERVSQPASGSSVSAKEPAPKAVARSWGADCAVKGVLPCRTLNVKSVSINMVQVPATPAGGFRMGSPESEPEREADETQHTVILSEPFWMATTEVSQALWSAVMGPNPSYFKSCGGDCPVEQVSWNDAIAFVDALNQLGDSQGGRFRLPTEAEWEWAARAQEGYVYAGANTLETVGWFSENSKKTSHAVATLKPNRWGLFDMSGNVWEWVQDGYDEYPAGPLTNPTGNYSASNRVNRGGSWLSDPSGARVAYRDGALPERAWYNLGLRLARSD